MEYPLMTRRNRIQNLLKQPVISAPPSELSIHPNNVLLCYRDIVF